MTEGEFLVNVRRNLHDIMVDRQITVGGLSDLTGIKVGALYSLCHGCVKPSLFNFLKICEALNLSVERVVSPRRKI